MPDVFDQNIAERQITKEVLEKLGIIGIANALKNPEDRINEYAKYFCHYKYR